jgi:hypothetical protein
MLAAIHAAHVVVDQLTQRFPNVSHVVVDKPLTIADSRWAIGAAFASGAAAIGSVAVAVATFVLAASTRKSVEKTKELVAGENLRFQTENTTRLMNDYLQVKIYQSPNADFSAYIATSNIINTSRHDLQVLKAQVKELPKQIADADGQAAAASIGFSGSENLGLHESTERLAQLLRAEYEARCKELDAFVNSVGIFDNFFKNAHHLLAKDLLNVGLFNLNFAMTYLEARRALDILEDLLPVPLGNRVIHAELGAHFKAYLETEGATGFGG